MPALSLFLLGQVPAPVQPQLPPERALQHTRLSDDSIRVVPLPTEELRPFTPEQDSAYVRALRTRVPALARFQAELRRSSSAWLEFQQRPIPTPWQSALRNLQLESSVLAPTGEELVQHTYNLQQAQALPNPTLRRTPGSGLTVPLAAIARFLGLSEDVSPTIRYDVPALLPVQIVVYSVQAIRVATLVDALHRPGRYSVTWNGRDGAGRALPPGEYIAEVRIGEQRFYKRIRLSVADIR
jgi:hypothetical protein